MCYRTPSRCQNGIYVCMYVGMLGRGVATYYLYIQYNTILPGSLGTILAVKLLYGWDLA